MFHFALMLLSGGLVSAVDESPINSGGFGDGSTVVFLGDSITYQAHFSEYVQGFFCTRYPEMRIRFVNAGIPGHSAANALSRFDSDVARLKPAAVVIMFGMNDGAYQDLKEANRLAAYQENMGKLVKLTKAIGAKPILMSPTPFDVQTYHSRRDDPLYRFRGSDFSENYNYVLAYYGAWCRDMADREQAIFVNVYGPMNDFIYEQRIRDPGFTLMPDAIHPDPAGHFLMAFSLVKRLAPDRESVGRITIDRRDGEWKACMNDVQIKGLGGNQSRLFFRSKARALPWLIPERHTLSTLRWNNPSNGRSMYAAVRAGQILGAEVIQVTGLVPGDYAIRFDGVEIAQTNHTQLATGLEIQENEKTPQHKQSLLVAHLNRKLSDEIVRPLRDLIGKRLTAAGKAPEKVAAFDETNRTAIQALEKKRDEIEGQIYQTAQPTWHQVEIDLIQQMP